MKQPADYLPQPLPHDTGPVVTYQAALDGIQAALNDAENYKYLLLRAVTRNSTPPTTTPES